MNIFQQFYKSLYSPETIAKFRFQKIGKTILYIFFFMLIATIPPSWLFGSSIQSFFTQTETHLQETFPDFSIENGVLLSDLEEPLILEENGEFIIFDSTGELTPSDVADYDPAFALLEREALIVADGVYQSFNYQDIALNITRDSAIDLVESVGGILPLLIGLLIVFMYLFATGMKFIGIFTLSFVALLMRRRRGVKVTYAQCWTLAAYTATLPTILLALFDTLALNVPYSFTIYWIIAFIMLYLVFNKIPQPKMREEQSEDK
ncbi:hypothetical protein J2S74_001774 [Evansella vedderi]|uniref:DUF1189 domain-containing protein n=1 Tax=Evansella vedderi TaxID=38282 RepID=A0ABT9ZT39_9BACI|nr:DUF1189 domain-containing protein [Evansella vedderi]MDQ0254399.1 hypothetical protein [Evansella vedderi]